MIKSSTPSILTAQVILHMGMDPPNVGVLHIPLIDPTPFLDGVLGLDLLSNLNQILLWGMLILGRPNLIEIWTEL